MFGAYLCFNFSGGSLQIFHIFVCNFFRDFLKNKCIENLKSGSRSSRACNALNFLEESLGVKFQFTIHFFFSEQPFYGNYSTLESLTNTVNFSRVCLRSILNECNLYCKIEKYCILFEACMIKSVPHSTVSPQM